MQQVDVLDVEQSAFLDQPRRAQQLFHVIGVGFGESHRSRLLVLLEILVAELRHQLVRRDVVGGGVLRRTGYDDGPALFVRVWGIRFLLLGSYTRRLW